MRRLMGMLAMVLVLVALPALSQAQTLRLILKDHSVVTGTVLGVDEGVLSVQTDAGKEVDVPLAKVKKAFDADTSEVVSLDSLAGAKPATASASADDQADEAPAPKAKRHHAARAAQAAVDEQSEEMRHYRARKTTSEILDWTGLGVGLVGIVVMGCGVSEMNNATSTYYKSTNNNAGAYYTISGEPGYYTADQVASYDEGQGWAITGGVVTVAGLITTIIGAAISPRNPEGAMLHIEGSQVALAMPALDVTRSGEMRTTLVGARF
jgi:hypothetical protein